jgi:hypothetical protein
VAVFVDPMRGCCHSPDGLVAEVGYMRGWNKLCCALLCWGALSGWAIADEPKLAALDEAPTGFSAAVTATLAAKGIRISDGGKTVCDVWLAKDPAVKSGFTPNIRIQYPFQNGQLIGAIRFPEGTEPHDFRGQSIKPGTYTLRYGLQPDDGNHLGTSEIRDFLCACPADADADPKRIEKIKDVFKLSAKVAGTTHPTIFLLLPPPEKPVEAATVRADGDKHFVIVTVPATGKGADGAVPLTINFVAVGEHEG